MSGWRRLRWWFRSVSTQDIDRAVSNAKSDEDWRHVLWLCNRHLRRNPQSVPVVLMRARCYQALGDKGRYREEVALAHALDDTFVPAILQQVGDWIEDKRTQDALGLIGQIKDHPAVKDTVDSMLGALAARRAQADLASEYQLRAWMANFDHLRYANSFLFGLTYADVEEQRMASEHLFWAETLLPYADPPPGDRKRLLKSALLKLGLDAKQNSAGLRGSTARMRIGYWGGDFKEHSVRYFFRPLLEGHDRSAVEVFVYDDNFMNAAADLHTEAIRSHSDHFFLTSKLSDDEVVTLIQSHDLDVIVDVQGHTSANRLNLWQTRLAKVHMTGLAYPPTTGLSSIDFKFVDRHMVNAGTECYYTERQLVFPESFWCFDPKADAPYNPEPPYKRVGHITLGCWGNAAKISKALMRAWARILHQAPQARLHVVSHTFGDPVTENAFKEQMGHEGIPLDRLTCRGAYSLDELWIRYQEVDLMLDTYPFNGGTTSSWSLYAGVPVLTMAGASLQSRMGQSMMNNLGFPEYVVHSLDAYVARALDIIRDPQQLDAFRAVARQRFKSNALGDGKQYAAHFEALCRQALARTRGLDDDLRVPSPRVPPLELEEMLRRARMIRYHGQIEAFDRVLRMARKHYGSDVRIAEIEAEHLLEKADWQALESLLASQRHQTPYLLHVSALMALFLGRQEDATEHVRSLLKANEDFVEHTFGSVQNFRLQKKLWEAWLTTRPDEGQNPLHEHSSQGRVRWLVVVIGRDERTRRKCQQHIQQLLDTRHIPAEVRTCDFWERVEFINKILDQESADFDHVVIMRDHLEWVDADVLRRLELGLKQADVVSPAGALRWIQKDWAQDLPQFKRWGLMRPSRIDPNWVELHFAGDDHSILTLDAQVLDGQLLAFNPAHLRGIGPREGLQEAGYWAEEEWTHRLAKAGIRLAIHRCLGILVRSSPDAMNLHTSTGLQEVLNQLQIDPLALPIENFDIQTVHVKKPTEGLLVGKTFLT